MIVSNVTWRVRGDSGMLFGGGRGAIGAVSARSNGAGRLEKVGSGGTASTWLCEPNTGATPSGAVVGRICSPAVDFDLLLEAVVTALLADGVLLCMRLVCLEDLALLVVDGANLVLPGSFRDLVPRSLLMLLFFECPMPGKAGKAQS